MTPTDKILAIARSFPCLESRLRHWEPKQFDPDALYTMSGPWSHGERLCVLAILNIWNPGSAKAKGWHFDLFEFIGIADSANRDACIAWMENPIWP